MSDMTKNFVDHVVEHVALGTKPSLEDIFFGFFNDGQTFPVDDLTTVSELKRGMELYFAKRHLKYKAAELAKQDIPLHLEWDKVKKTSLGLNQFLHHYFVEEKGKLDSKDNNKSRTIMETFINNYLDYTKPKELEHSLWDTYVGGAWNVFAGGIAGSVEGFFGSFWLKDWYNTRTGEIKESVRNLASYSREHPISERFNNVVYNYVKTAVGASVIAGFYAKSLDAGYAAITHFDLGPKYLIGLIPAVFLLTTNIIWPYIQNARNSGIATPS